jgi:hypothetical protein
MNNIKLRRRFQHFLTYMSSYCRHFADAAMSVHIGTRDTNRLYDVTEDAGRLRLSQLPIFGHPVTFLTDQPGSRPKALDLHS